MLTSAVLGTGDVDHGAGPVARQVGDLHDLAVGRDDDLAVDGAQLRDPQGDVLDRALDRTAVPGDREAHHVADSRTAAR